MSRTEDIIESIYKCENIINLNLCIPMLQCDLYKRLRISYIIIRSYTINVEM